ncbi:MAG: SpvB/TcaC N-terminal domain-containing protein [Chitinophagaceae bacterium]
MIRSFTFLLYFIFLLLAVVYPANQHSVNIAAANADVAVADHILPSASQVAENRVTDANEPVEIVNIPEPPQMDDYAPASIRGMEPADPAEGVNMISPATANSTGNAILNFPIKLPEGRQGMQPSLNILYNSEGVSTWLGYGWNLITPAISIDTRWGVPRYDNTNETEMYLFNGEPLAPVNNRSELVARTADKRFYQRVEGTFSKIIRHGNSPRNYWWEVTEKNGKRHFYGGKPGTGVVTNAVLTDANGNVGYWALVQSIDLDDNTVHYLYTTVTDPGIAGSTSPGKQLYPDKIFYTGTGEQDGPYKVEFKRDRQLGQALRKDITIDARTGFKIVSADLLRTIKISINNAPVRSYECNYEEGAFYKTLLKSIGELDTAGTLVYTHSFTYYDDVRKGQDYAPSGGDSTWNMPGDDVKGTILNPIPGFTGEGSALSTSAADSWSAGFALTVGTMAGDAWSKRMTVGGFYNYGKDAEEGLVSMIDINGDGLPDKVFKKDGRLFYRKNLGLTSRSFGDVRNITGINDFSASNSVNNSGGVQVIPLVAFLGYCNTTTTTTTTVYFSDFNGDGLMDVADNGKVYFNHLNAQGDPVFDRYSTLTPNPIFTGTVDRSFLGRDTALQSQQERDFPLQDIIRFWEAPVDDTINITAPLQLVGVPTTAKQDGVRASIQLGDVVLWSTVIDAYDHSIKTPTGLNNLHISKGQRVYFRLQSRYNGENDVVNWDPVIEYTKPVTPSACGPYKEDNYYKASADFILHNKGATLIGKNGTIAIDGSFKKLLTTDSVVVTVLRKSNAVTSILFEKGFAARELADGELPVPGQFAVQMGDELYFQLVSRSPIDRSALLWKPHYAYVAFPDNTPVISGNGLPTIYGYPVPDNSNYNNRFIAAAPVTVAQQDTVILWPQVSGGGDGTLWFTIKGTDTVYARRRIIMNGGTMNTAMDSIRLIRKANEPLFMEFATDTFSFAQNLQAPYVDIYRDSIFNNGAVLDTIRLHDTAFGNLYTNPAQELMGALFRGWGQFGFKGDKGDGPLDQSKLNLNNLDTYPNDPGAYTDTASLGGIQNPSSGTDFTILFPDMQLQRWVGLDTSVYIDAGNMSSARLWMQDVSVDSITVGESAFAFNKVSTTKTQSFAAGVSAAVEAVYGTSNATTVYGTDMMDMNGDRYPDLLIDEQIQYTLPHGGLGGNPINHGVGQTFSNGWSEGLSGGGEFQRASTKNNTKSQSVAAQRTAKASPGISGSLNNNSDRNDATWIDMNGDGLTDRVYGDGTVSLNLGYSFGARESWGIPDVEKSSSTSYGAGLGVTYGAASFQVGFGLSRTTGDNSVLLNDVNGDGLPDYTTMSGGGLSVRLNTGSGFGPALAWKDFMAIASNVSTGESLNTAATGTINIFIILLKICFNPSGNKGHGVSRQQDMVMDLDGDGFADLLHSDNDGHLKASVSTIGRTNLLKQVNRPLGASFTLDYERTGNTYKMPQSKWVLKSVDLFDGLAGDGVDTVRSRFSYEDGYYDRREREFYGFARVISRELNPVAGNTLYRSKVQQFLNTSFYNKGLLAAEWLEDAAGNKFTVTNYQYELRPVLDFVQFPALIQTEKQFYEGKTTAGATAVTAFEYDAIGNTTRITDKGDGSQQDIQVTNIAYHDIDQLYLKTVPSRVEITTSEGTKRLRTTFINGEGDIIRIRQFLADGTYADTDLEYDDYGNLTKLTRPANYKDQRMWYSYEYDNVVHSYPTRTTDAFGYISSSTYDYRFGALTGTVSINDEHIQYKLDNLGRITAITAPYELEAGKPYSIAYTYNTGARVPYAVTKYYDPEYGTDITLLKFTDGLGRTVQSKKQAALFKGKGVADEVKMVVSGRNTYDAFGRITKTYLPVTESTGTGMETLNATLGNLKATISYDVVDRKIRTVLADGTATAIAYTVDNGLLSQVITDALQHRRETLTDVRDRKRAIKAYSANGAVTTLFDYDPLGQLLKATDAKGNVFKAVYDNLGRKLSAQHPDAGVTEFVYDAAGNLLKKITPRIRKEIPVNGAIQYQYDYERLTDIDYPRNYQDKVKYTYGKAGTGSKTGRLILQEDASGGQEFFYGKQGELIKVIRTVLISPLFATTYVSEQEYDTWGRLKKLIYPDGEAVSYHYNKGGSLYSMEGIKQGSVYKYVDQAGYDEYDQRVYLRYGNGAENMYRYDSLHRRLTQLQAVTPNSRMMMNNVYSYDAVSNVLGVVNNTQARNGVIGGPAKQQYHYDDLYRIDSATGEYKGSTDSAAYSIKVSYDELNNIVQKSMSVKGGNGYDLSYTYDLNAPHHAVQIGASQYRYDPDGNQSGDGEIENYWNEESRLMAVISKGILSQYTYDASGKRAIRSSGGLQGVWLNGAPAGAVKHTDNYSADVSPYIVCRKDGFTKHYYIENQRIASKLGHGTFTNINFPQTGLTAGGIDYSTRALAIEQSRNNYYSSLGISPGPPTDKNYYAKPENNGIAAPVVTDSTAADIPPGWPGNTTPPPDGPPVFVGTIPSRDSVNAGYGFQDAGHLYEGSQFFFHPDHTGSTAYITNALGEASQHAEYTPFGEVIAAEHAGTFTTSYLFNGKGWDSETGYYYYGSRYYEPLTSQWLSLDDPLGENYPYTAMEAYALTIGGDGVDNDKLNNSNADAVELLFSGGEEIFTIDVDNKKKNAKKDKAGAGRETQMPKSTTPKPVQLRNLHNMNKKAPRLLRNPNQKNALFFSHGLNQRQRLNTSTNLNNNSNRKQ